MMANLESLASRGVAQITLAHFSLVEVAGDLRITAIAHNERARLRDR